MDLNKFTQKAQEAIYASQQLARDFGHQTIEPAHLLLALIQQNEGVVPAVITKVAGNTQALLQDVKKESGVSTESIRLVRRYWHIPTDREGSGSCSALR